MAGRTKKAFLNVSSGLFVQILKSILSFIVRSVFIQYLGRDALGLNGLFTNILSMLSLAELGVGTAISFSLYGPLANNKTKKISSLMTFYKKAYRVIGLIVAALGLLLVPLLHFLVKDIDTIKDAYAIYLLFLLNTVSSYFIAYKETLINADQKSYKLTKINILFLVIMYVAQIATIIVTKDFVLYLVIQFIVQLIQRIAINIFVTKEYRGIDFSSKDSLDKQDLSVIKKNIKAMMIHKVGDYCVNGTDNILISSMINIGTVGLYSNYTMVLSIITTFVNLIFNNLVSGLGNLVVMESDNKKYEVFQKIDFIGFMAYGFCSVMLLNVFNDFISIWAGVDYCLDFAIVVAIITSFYLAGLRIAPNTIKMAAGMYDVDKFTPIIQSAINLVVSIILASHIGLMGVIIGTIVSSLALPSWQRPYIVYKHIFKQPFDSYLRHYLKNIIVIVMVSTITLIINNNIMFESTLFTMVVKMVIVTIVFASAVVIIYRDSMPYRYLMDTIKKTVKRGD